jgi:predicted metal-binding membrane protein
MQTAPGPIETLLRRERAIILAGVVALTLAAWGYLVHHARSMGSARDMAMPGMSMPGASWGAVELLLLFVMWTVMMVAMMVPSAAPLVLMFARMKRRGSERHGVEAAALLLSGYLVVWTGFSAMAALAQWTLHRAALLSPGMASTSSMLGGLVLLAAGAFQFTPLKRACLMHCRSPAGFLMSEWRAGRWGALRMGMKHGLYCVGCCWLLMAILFVAGVMSLLTVAAIGALVLLEKCVPNGERLGRVAGAALIAAGIVLVLD